MSEVICEVLFTVCLNICAGICLDFASIRHACTEHLCSCSCCMERKDALERQRLIDADVRKQRLQPEPRPAMQVPNQ